MNPFRVFGSQLIFFLPGDSLSLQFLKGDDEVITLEPGEEIDYVFVFLSNRSRN